MAVPLVFFLLGFGLLFVCLVCGAVFLLIKLVGFSKAASFTQGEAIDFVQEREANGGLVYHLVVQFPVVETGSMERKTFDFVSAPPGYRVGDPVPVFYHPANPLQARIGSRRWLPPVLLILIGGGFFCSFLSVCVASPFSSVIISLLVSLSFIGGGVFMLIDGIRFRRKAFATEGEVIDLVLRGGGKGGPTYRPIVAFWPAGASPAEKVIFESRVGSRPPSYRIGARVLVLYDPANPFQARINSWAVRWLVPGLLILLGGGVLIFGIFFLGRIQR